MKEVRICFEVQGLGVDENGNSCAVGMQFSIGEVSDEKYESIDYFEAMKGVKAIEMLNVLGLKTFAANRSEDDFRLISPEEYDQKYGEGQDGEGERIDRICATCRYGAVDELADRICVNVSSEHCADWVGDDDSCAEWEQMQPAKCQALGYLEAEKEEC